LTNATVVKSGADDTQAGLDIAQTFPISQLGKSHHLELLVRSERPCPEIAMVTPHAHIELVLGQDHPSSEKKLCGHNSWASVAQGQPGAKPGIVVQKLK